MKEFKLKTSKNSDIHNTFKFLLDTKYPRMPNHSEIKNKYSELSVLKMKDCELEKSMNLVNLQEAVKIRLKNVEHEEHIVTRLIERKNYLSIAKVKQDRLTKEENGSIQDQTLPESDRKTVDGSKKSISNPYSQNNPLREDPEWETTRASIKDLS
jgi:CRISPR/Cas system-associated protein Cas5 (RAMP superfamily)